MAKAKEIVELDCESDAIKGMALVLHARLAELCELREHALNWEDIEGVHDMRVASRRLRSALLAFEPYLSKRVPIKKLKKIARTLGAVRDQDVALVSLDELRAEAAPDTAAGIEQLAQRRRQKRESARAKLTEEISVEALESLQRKFDATLKRATEQTGKRRKHDDDDNEQAVSFRQLGREIILRQFSEVQSLSSSLYRPLVPEPLHRMRVAAKRLRYAIELFAPCWGEHLAPIAEDVAELQKSLGELHDYDVWIDDLGKRLLQHQESDHQKECASSDETLERHAAIWLLSQFTKARTKHFRDALARWHTWETTDFAAQLGESLMLNENSAIPATPLS